MLGRFAIEHFCCRFLYGKMAAYLNGEIEGLFSFWVVYWIVGRLALAEFSDRRGKVLRSRCPSRSP